MEALIACGLAPALGWCGECSQALDKRDHFAADGCEFSTQPFGLCNAMPDCLLDEGHLDAPHLRRVEIPRTRRATNDAEGTLKVASEHSFGDGDRHGGRLLLLTPEKRILARGLRTAVFFRVEA